MWSRRGVAAFTIAMQGKLDNLWVNGLKNDGANVRIRSETCADLDGETEFGPQPVEETAVDRTQMKSQRKDVRARRLARKRATG